MSNNNNTIQKKLTHIYISQLLVTRVCLGFSSSDEQIKAVRIFAIKSEFCYSIRCIRWINMPLNWQRASAVIVRHFDESRFNVIQYLFELTVLPSCQLSVWNKLESCTYYVHTASHASDSVCVHESKLTSAKCWIFCISHERIIKTDAE